MGRQKKQRGRAVNGILILDKPAGVTSNFALQKVKRIFGAAKAGHTGSLDPLATGVLPLCFGEATKFSQYLLDSNKRYVVRAKLGVATDTGDFDGKIIEEKPVPELDEADLRKVISDFEGDIEQIPPMFSALKHQGQPLYKLAREGVEVERKPRKVTLFSIVLLSFSDDELELDVSCSKGTYIRTLIEDIGKVLGCGAHVTVLRRTEAGPYCLGQSISFDNIDELLQVNLDPDNSIEQSFSTALLDNKQSSLHDYENLDSLLLPIWSAISDWPEVILPENTAYYLRQGQAVKVPEAPVEGWVRLSQENECFLGVGQILDDGRIAPRRLVSSHSQ